MRKIVAILLTFVVLCSMIFEGKNIARATEGSLGNMVSEQVETSSVETCSVETNSVETCPVETNGVEKKGRHKPIRDRKRQQDMSNTEQEPKQELTKALSMNDIILETLTDAKNNALNKYIGYYTKEIEAANKSKYILSTMNYRQSDLNVSYYNTYKQKIAESCAEVSATSIAEYYTRKKYAVTLGHDKYTTIFNQMINYGLITGAYTKDGTYPSRLWEIYHRYYQGYNKNLSGNYITSGMDNQINVYNMDAKPMAIGIKAPNGDNHTVTVAGYYDIIVKYKKKKNSSYGTKTYTYYAINDGYKNCESGDMRIQYVQKKYVYGATYLY